MELMSPKYYADHALEAEDSERAKVLVLLSIATSLLVIHDWLRDIGELMQLENRL